MRKKELFLSLCNPRNVPQLAIKNARLDMVLNGEVNWAHDLGLESK